jgi:hypothetical protein
LPRALRGGLQSLTCRDNDLSHLTERCVRIDRGEAL